MTAVRAQCPHDTCVYAIVLEEMLASGALAADEKIAMPDSTCKAVFYGGFPDSINVKYFGFSESNYFDAEVFRRAFVENTAVAEPLPESMFSSQRIVRLSMTYFRNMFSVPKNQGKIVLSEKGFEKLSKYYYCECFCEFSRPYHVKEDIILVYINIQCGLQNSFQNIYLLIRGNEQWRIITKLREWNF